jgi:hypothetical protein
MVKRMEAILSSGSPDTDVLSPSLKYGLDPSGSWCTGKRNATVYALGSSYSPSGVKMISFQFGSTTEHLVPESIVFSANFQAPGAVGDAGSSIFPANPDANVLFERIDIRLSGQLIESISESARCQEFLTRLTMSPQKKLNLAQMGFGTQVPTAEPDWSAAQNHDAGVVAAGTTKRIMWKANLSGLLSQHRWIPLYATTGLTVSFFLAPGSESCIKSHGGINYAQDYTLSDVKAHCAMQTIDDTLSESLQGQLLQGTALRIPFKKLESMWSYIPQGIPSKFTIPMNRSYTRLCSLFASFVQEPAAEGKAKLCNQFFVNTASAETLQYNLQIGSQKLYDNDPVGFAESWMRLLDGVGIGNSLSHATGITYADYATNSFGIVADLEKISHLASTGANLSGTSTVLLQVSGFGTTAAHLPSRCHLMASYDAVLEVRDTTVEIFE